MSERFAGAITTPAEPTNVDEPPAERPPRPLSLEVSVAILVVGGLTSAIGLAATALTAGGPVADPAARPIVALILALDVLTVVVGVLVHRGRAWILCVNVVAIVLFIELTAIPTGSAVALLLSVLDVFVFVSLMRNRAWFDWRADRVPVDHASADDA